MSLDGITSSIMDSLEKLLTDQIKNMVPALFAQISPFISDMVKNEVAQYFSDNSVIELSISNTIKECLVNVDEDIRKFDRSYARIMDTNLHKREQEYYKYARCESTLQLYNDCMQSEPCYIPRKFRSDKFHVMSERELNILKKAELQKFQSQCEIENARREEYSKRCFAIDDEIHGLIKRCKISDTAEQKLLDKWQKLVKEDMDRINKKMETKRVSTKKAYEKDKEFLQKHQKQRVKTTTSNVPTPSTSSADSNQPGPSSMPPQGSALSSNRPVEVSTSSRSIPDTSTNQTDSSTNSTQVNVDEPSENTLPTSNAIVTNEGNSDNVPISLLSSTPVTNQSTKGKQLKSKTSSKNLIDLSFNHPPIQEEKPPSQNTRSQK